MAEIALIALITIFAVIGMGSVWFALHDLFVSGGRSWDSKILLYIEPSEQVPVERLLDTVDYVRARYFPEMEATVFCSRLSDDELKRARLAAEEFGIVLR